MTYEETLKFLFERLPMYQRDGKSAYKKDLSNTIALLKVLGNPHRKFKSVHIAGTNGKGTSAHGIAAILQTSGYKTGLYTSPHLKSFTERIKINGVEIGEKWVVSFVDRIQEALEDIQPSFFEITVAMAFDYFASEQVDIAVIETGLGGRLDSTNVIAPEACLITNIGYDHTDMLGDTLEKIAAEKAGIIKRNTPVVIGEYHAETFPVFLDKAKREHASLVFETSNQLGELTSLPYFKRLNYAAVNALCRVLRDAGWDQISNANIKEGYIKMEKITGFKGRFQKIGDRPTVYADVSHNTEGLREVFRSLQELAGNAKLHVIFGTVKDKDLTPILALIPKSASIYWTQSQVPRSLDVNELAIQGIMQGIQGECFRDVNEALKQARHKAQSSDTILVTGSTFVVAELDEL